MEIDWQTGCITDSLKIDNKESINISIDELKTIAKKLIDNADVSMLQQFIIDMTECNGEVTYMGHCDDCGDTIYHYHFVVDD